MIIKVLGPFVTETLVHTTVILKLSLHAVYDSNTSLKRIETIANITRAKDDHMFQNAPGHSVFVDGSSMQAT